MPHAFDRHGTWVRVYTTEDVRALEHQHEQRQRITRRGTTALFLAIVAALLSWGVWQAMVDLGNGIIR